jgi:hypothetical protein
MDDSLFIVSPTKPGTYSYMKLVTTDTKDVVTLDRRKAERRGIHQRVTPERRKGERRRGEVRAEVLR